MITVKEVCDRYKVTSRTVYRWIKDGAPFKKIGSKHFLSDYESLETWFKEKGE